MPLDLNANPYLAVIFKKQRAARKKLERIAALELQQQQGSVKEKQLHGEQVLYCFDPYFQSKGYY